MENCEVKGNLKQKQVLTEVGIFLLLALISFIVLMFASKNSFLFKINEWTDLNCYLTMGRGMVDGKIMYKDIFDHKGPLVYFLFAFINLFPNVYLATFAVECVCLTLFLFISYKIARRNLNTGWSIFAVAVTGVIVCFSKSFGTGGGAVEEFLLPIFAYFILLLLKNVEDNYVLTKKDYAIIGVLGGIILFCKFTLLLLPFLVLVVILFNNWKKLDKKQFFLNLCIMAGSFLTLCVPIFIYFLLNNAVFDLLYSYFYCNLFMYAGGKTNYLLKNLGCVIECGWMIVPAILGVVFSIIKNRDSKRKIIELSFVFLGVLLFLIVMKSYVYYFHQLAVFVVLFFSYSISFVIKNSTVKNLRARECVALTVVTTFALLNFFYGVNFGDMKQNKEELIQFQVANEIKAIGGEESTIYCYKMYDIGFYEVMGRTPPEKYFIKYNFTETSFPELFENYKDAIENQVADFVLMYRKDYDLNKVFVDTKYNIINEYKSIINSKTHDSVNVCLLRKITE